MHIDYDEMLIHNEFRVKVSTNPYGKYLDNKSLHTPVNFKRKTDYRKLGDNFKYSHIILILNKNQILGSISMGLMLELTQSEDPAGRYIGNIPNTLLL